MRDANPNTEGSLWQRIQERLKEHGIFIGVNSFEDLAGLSDLADLDISCRAGSKGGIKVVCVAPDLQDSVDELGAQPRNQVVMVRVDESTRDQLDGWVATGAVKSRSEAAALFIREGLKVRSDELEQLRGALRELREAQDKLREQARQVFGGAASDSPDPETGAGDQSAPE